MITRDEIIEIGQFNKPHGISGEISASFTCDAEVLDNFSCYIIDINGIYVPFFIESLRPKNDHTVLLKFEGMNSDESVKQYSNRSIYVLKKEYDAIITDENEDDDDSATPADYFIGYKIIDVRHGEIGEIIDIDDSTENALFIVMNDEKEEFYIPITEDFITGIDDTDLTINMSLPDGILDL